MKSRWGFMAKCRVISKLYQAFTNRGQDLVDDSPQRERNVRFARRRKFCEVLDVGCGSEVVLDAAKRAGLQTFGLGLNRATADAGSGFPEINLAARPGAISKVA